MKIKTEQIILKSILLLFINHPYLLKTQTPFVDITAKAGIQHQFKVFEGMFGGGACVVDINNDGFEDLYITGGMNDDILYMNQKDGTFKNIFETSGLSVTKHFVTQGVISADVNHDGWPDLFITTITSRDSVKVIPRAINLLFINDHHSNFHDATTEYRLDKMNSFSTGASFGDINQDGYPDLYVGNYFHEYQGDLTAINDATIVNANQTARGYLLLNKGGKYFSNVYDQFGMNHKGFGFGGVFTDFDNDDDQDIFINQDFGYKAIPDFLYENQYPRNKFKDVSEALNMDLKINSMGTAVGDYDNDGDMDYYVTNIRFNYFMVNQGKGKPFQNKAKELGMSYVSISWGANFEDFDQDGDLDLFVANGDLNPNCVPMADFYFKNDHGIFTESARAMGLNDYGVGRGSVTFDYDQDGDMDILVVNQKPVLDYPVSSMTRLYRNDSAQGNWFKVKLNGNQSETNGISVKVTLISGASHMIREVDGGNSSHLSQNSKIVHFGLNSLKTIDSLIITWKKDKKQIFTNQSVNQLFIVNEPLTNQSGKYKYIYYGISIIILLFLFNMLRPKLKK